MAGGGAQRSGALAGGGIAARNNPAGVADNREMKDILSRVPASVISGVGAASGFLAGWVIRLRGGSQAVAVGVALAVTALGMVGAEIANARRRKKQP